MIIVEAAMKVECPYCKEKYNIKRSQLGKRAVCNMCEQSFVLYVEGVEPPKPRKKNPKLVKHIVSVIVLLAVLGGGAYWLFALNGLEKVKALISSKTSDQQDNASANIRVITEAELLSSSNNLKSIALGLVMVAGDSGGMMPESLNVLKEKNQLNDPNVFIAPFDKVSTPATDKITADNTTYAYVGAGLKSRSQVIVAFEKPWLFPEGWNKINVLKADGSVSRETIDGLKNMTCRQVVEVLTKDEQDKQIVETLLKNADNEDNSRKQEEQAPQENPEPQENSEPQAK